MIKNGFIAIVSFLFMLSCNNVQKPRKPDNFIKKDKMADILYDISLMRTLRTYNMNEMRTLGIEPDSFIYKKYGVDSLQFSESINYYSVNFNEFTTIWNVVNERLTKQRDSLQFALNDKDSIQKVKAKIRADSIRKSAKTRDSIRNLKKQNDSLLAPIGD